MKIGFVDADLIDNGTRFPNLALMKIASFEQNKGNLVSLIVDDSEIDSYDKIYVSKVFTKTKEPSFLNCVKCKIERGGTGYFLENAIPLDYEIEHCIPYYDLYKEYVNDLKGGYLIYYNNSSIGFTTRGCFRKCKFCVNKNSSKSVLWSPVDEFFEDKRRLICLLDDNFFACKDWQEIASALSGSKKTITFRQGLDIRLMSEHKAMFLENIKYYKDVMFAFDNIADSDQIERAFKIYRRYCNKPTSCYVLCNFYQTGENEINSFLDRAEILKKYNICPYVMLYNKHIVDQFSSIWSGIQGWANMKTFWKTMNYFDINNQRSKKAVNDAYMLLTKSTVDRLKKNYWK